jgi:hypothetical protein
VCSSDLQKAYRVTFNSPKWSIWGSKSLKNGAGIGVKRTLPSAKPLKGDMAVSSISN